jgi:hypothetical protein
METAFGLSELRMAYSYLQDIVWFAWNKGMAAASSAKDFPLLFVGILIGAIFISVFERSHAKATSLKTSAYQAPVKTKTDIASVETEEDQSTEHSTYLVLDVEGTCEPGKNFDYPNEIIVCGGFTRLVIF